MTVYHHRIMRTTVDIPDHLLIEAKQLAAERHLPLTRLFEDSLRFYLGEQRLRHAQDAPAPLPLLRDPVLVAGIDLDDTSRLWELEWAPLAPPCRMTRRARRRSASAA